MICQMIMVEPTGCPPLHRSSLVFWTTVKTKDIHSHHFGLHLFYIIVRSCNVGIRSRFLWIGASISPFSRVKGFVECFVSWVEMFSGTFVDICAFIVEVHDANLIFWDLFVIFILRLESLFAISFLRLAWSSVGLRRTSTSSPSWISKILDIVLRLLVLIPDVCSPRTNTIDKNKDVHDDYKDGNEGLKDPGRQGRRRPEEPCFNDDLSVRMSSRVWVYLVYTVDQSCS